MCGCMYVFLAIYVLVFIFSLRAFSIDLIISSVVCDCKIILHIYRMSVASAYMAHFTCRAYLAIVHSHFVWPALSILIMSR